ncbi:GlxA family transcriptional regulator [Methylocystis bryophila]|uniref:AraC family transcriptional regulator n=1 Tax=Methylocystis bryophila TaxID=655015 RepID=A0A1W6MQB9_9HYPH|nr:GlxA family transcriptional regulator [Methylocystis bryophila]ARN79788.1 AraC family transcriptional regulator [Methylocystis bryophila]
MQHKVTFLVHPKFESLDLSGPCSAFNLVNEFYDSRYAINVVSAEGGEIIDRAGIIINSKKFADVAENETILVVGGPAAHLLELDPATKNLLAEYASPTNRVASVCTGAFLLASAGLLDDRRATTHWRYAGILQSRYPRVQVDADRIFIKDGNVWTSAGLTAGIDLALALIENDCGSDIAKGVARDMVVYHRRLGGQSQYSTMLEIMPTSHRVREALCYARAHLDKPLSVETLADAAGVGLRQFSRIFINATGTTPAKAVERLRLEAARPKIEEGSEPIERIAQAVGFGSADTMCRSFVKACGRTPQELRRSARKHPGSNPSTGSSGQDA